MEELHRAQREVFRKIAFSSQLSHQEINQPHPVIPSGEDRELANSRGSRGTCFLATEGVGSDCSAHVSFARIRPAGNALHAARREGARSGARGQEVTATV